MPTQAAFQASAQVTLDPKSLEKASRRMQQALGRISGQASEFQKSLDASTARVFAFGATTAVLSGVAGAFKSLVSSTIDVEKRLIEIQSIIGGTEAEFSAFRDTIFSVAQSTGQSFSVVADAAAELARQGLSASESAKRLEAALILTRVSGLDSVKSVAALTAAINGFTSAGLTAEQITNKLIAVDTKFAVSSKDLAEAFSRAGSTAEDAGVSFDELLGIVTAVQQTTSRGGAVIGNALKSIFTRLSRGSTIEDLQALGVAINSSQSGVEKLNALATALSQISDPSQASAIKELAGGVYQINLVSAALKDLQSQNSLFSQASKASAEATNEAYQKNALLNTGIAAQINSLIVGVTNLAEKIGQLTFAPLLKSILGIANKFSEFLNNAFDPETGSKFIQGLFKSIGSFLSGPALVLFTSAFLKIFTLVARYAKDGFSSILKIGGQAEKIKEIEGGIVGLLSKNDELRKKILSGTLSEAEKHKLIIEAIKQENQLLEAQRKILSDLASLAYKSGAKGFSSSGGFKGNVKGQGFVPQFASGFVPNFSFDGRTRERQAAKEHGYTAGNVYQTTIHDGNGKSFKSFVNSKETVTNFTNGKGNRATVVKPPNGFSDKTQFAANGFVPNFAGGKFAGADNINNFLSKAKLSGKTYTFPDGSTASQAQVDNVLKRKQKSNSIIDIEKVLRKEGVDGLPTILTPNSSGISPQFKKNFKGLGKDANFSFDSYKIKNSGKGNLESQVEKDFTDAQIDKFATERVLSLAQSISRSVGASPVEPKTLDRVDGVKGFRGAVRGAFGALFDAAITTGLDLTSNQKDGGDFDFRASRNTSDQLGYIKTLFGENSLGGSGLADFKIGLGRTTSESMTSKTFKEYESKLTPYLTGKKSLASGFVPNFAAKEDAISREMQAGIPKSAIRIGQDKSLVSSRNPYGEAIYNTLDEPLGLSQGINRAKKEGMNPKSYGSAKGYVPNFAVQTVNPVNISGGAGTKFEPLLKAINAELTETAKQLKAQNISLAQAQKQMTKFANNIGLPTEELRKLNPAINNSLQAFQDEGIKRKALAKTLSDDRNSVTGRAKRFVGRNGGNAVSRGFRNITQGEGAGKLQNAAFAAQSGLFALSTISNTLAGDNEKLNETVQKVTTGLSSILAVTSIAPALTSMLNPIGLFTAALGFAAYTIYDTYKYVKDNEAKSAKNQKDFFSNREKIGSKSDQISSKIFGREGGALNAQKNSNKSEGEFQKTFKTKLDLENKLRITRKFRGGGGKLEKDLIKGISKTDSILGEQSKQTNRDNAIAGAESSTKVIFDDILKNSISKAQDVSKRGSSSAKGVAEERLDRLSSLSKEQSSLEERASQLSKQDDPESKKELVSVQANLASVSNSLLEAQKGIVQFSISTNESNVSLEEYSKKIDSLKTLSLKKADIGSRITELKTKPEITSDEESELKNLESQFQNLTSQIKNTKEALSAAAKNINSSGKDFGSAFDEAKAKIAYSLNAFAEKINEFNRDAEIKGDVSNILQGLSIKDGPNKERTKNRIDSFTQTNKVQASYGKFFGETSKFLNSITLGSSSVAVDETSISAEVDRERVKLLSQLPEEDRTNELKLKELNNTLAGFETDTRQKQIEKNLPEAKKQIDRFSNESQKSKFAKDFLGEFVNGGEDAAKKFFEGNLDKVNLGAGTKEDAFKDLLSGAKEFKQDIIESSIYFKNKVTEIQSNLAKTSIQIIEKQKDALRGLPQRLSEILNGPKVDVLGLTTELTEGFKLRNSSDPNKRKEGLNVLAKQEEKLKNFEALRGKEATDRLVNNAGGDRNDVSKSVEDAQAQAFDLSRFESIIKNSFSGPLANRSLATLERAKKDPNELNKLSQILQDGLNNTSKPENRETLQNLINGIDAIKPRSQDSILESLKNEIIRSGPSNKQADSFRDVEKKAEEVKKDPNSEDAKKALADSVRKLFEGFNLSEAAVEKRTTQFTENFNSAGDKTKNGEDDELKALKNTQSLLNAELKGAEANAKIFSNRLKSLGSGTEIETSIQKLSEAVNSASDNLVSFGKLTKTLSDIEKSLFSRLSDIEKKLSSLNSLSPLGSVTNFGPWAR